MYQLPLYALRLNLQGENPHLDTQINNMEKHIYVFGDGKADGKAEMKNLLGGKGAGLAEMNRIGVPVPPGFTITTDVCSQYTLKGRDATFHLIHDDVIKSLAQVENITQTKFGSSTNPCLVSVRSGSRASMPGMMDTILNLGLNDDSVIGLAERTQNPRFAWDSYRRFISMYARIVMGLKPKTKHDIDPFEEILEKLKHVRHIEEDTELTLDDLKRLVTQYKDAVFQYTGKHFPMDPWQQLWGAIGAVFESWNNDRAIYYRQMNKIPEEWGTAVNVQAMVFGNMGLTSGTGVGFTRDGATGENIFNGEYLINAQGEDVVAGIRTPQQITLVGSRRWAEAHGISEAERKSKYPSLEEAMPEVYTQLKDIQSKLEKHYTDMQDIEFTIQNGKLWLLQTRNAKRTGAAMVKVAVDLLKEGIIDEQTALQRIDPARLDELLHPVFETSALKTATVLTKGLAASPGASSGQIVFFADEAHKFQNTILVRIETSPEDLEGMNISKGILTARGGMTSHAAVVARGMGKCCICGAGEIKVDYKNRTMEINGKKYNEGDWLSLDGSTGSVYAGKLPTQDPNLSADFETIMQLSNKYTRMNVRTNADTPKDALVARKFGAKGIGLCRTEHMFFDGERIRAMREMILSSSVEDRKAALQKLIPFQRTDFEGIFAAMDGYPVTIRLLDPPLHEFVPHQHITQKELAELMGLSIDQIKQKVSDLEEFNPMLGHRGCRLGITYPEITEMQTRAILEAALNLTAKGCVVKPEIMVPLIGNVTELIHQTKVIRNTANTLFKERGHSIPYLIGTMIEVPRAALTADEIAETTDFFSFGTNDLTQMALGFSRDDAGKFLPAYLEQGILKHDPFEVLDQRGVGQLVEMAFKKGRSANVHLKVGICGEHGGEPSSVMFCHRIGLDYVSCSPFRVPIARVAAALANLIK